MEHRSFPLLQELSLWNKDALFIQVPSEWNIDSLLTKGSSGWNVNSLHSQVDSQDGT